VNYLKCCSTYPILSNAQMTPIIELVIERHLTSTDEHIKRFALLAVKIRLVDVDNDVVVNNELDDLLRHNTIKTAPRALTSVAFIGLQPLCFSNVCRALR